MIRFNTKAVAKLTLVFFAALMVAGCKSIKPAEVDPYANSIRPSILGEWVLVSMQDQNGSYNVVDGITINFPEEPRDSIFGNGGVNVYNGTVDVTDTKFVQGPIAVTKMAGDPVAMEAEDNYFRILSLCDKIKVEDVSTENGTTKKLVLYNTDKTVQLEFMK